MPLWLWPTTPIGQQDQATTAALGLLSLGATDVAVSWPNPFTTTTYAVSALIEQGGLNVGAVQPTLKAGTRTMTGCTITLTNSAAVSIAAGAVLHVTAIGQ